MFIKIVGSQLFSVTVWNWRLDTKSISCRFSSMFWWMISKRILVTAFYLVFWRTSMLWVVCEEQCWWLRDGLKGAERIMGLCWKCGFIRSNDLENWISDININRFFSERIIYHQYINIILFYLIFIREDELFLSYCVNTMLFSIKYVNVQFVRLCSKISKNHLTNVIYFFSNVSNCF